METKNKNIIEQMFPEILKIKVKGDNIATMYNMVPYKSKVTHVEYDTLNLSPIKNNRKYFPREDKNCGNYYIYQKK